IFAGLAGLALLLVVGFFVWRGVTTRQPEKVEAREAAGVTQKEQKDRPLEPKEIFERCSPSVARVQVRVTETRGVTGSGFLAGSGIVVSNSHAISPVLASKIRVTFPSAAGGNTPLQATLLHEDRTRDLAILQVDTSFRSTALADGDCPPGEK